MAVDMTSDFFALDELIQVIYQGAQKFIVLSTVSSTAWTVHVTLDKTARWWSGKWSTNDIEEFMVLYLSIRRFYHGLNGQ